MAIKDPRFVPKKVEDERKANPIAGKDIYNNTILPEHTTFFNNGYIIQPNRPAFLLGWPGAMSLTTTAVVPPTGGSVEFNTGGYFNTSTMRFTCPVAGLYSFGFSYLRIESAIIVRGNIYKNGTSLNQQLRSTAGFSGYNYTAGQWYITYGNVGDYFELKISADSPTTLYSDSGSRQYNWLCGYLIG
jgi:hypothetical protein